MKKKLLMAIGPVLGGVAGYVYYRYLGCHGA